MRENSIHRERLTQLREALDAFSLLLLENLNQIKAYLTSAADQPAPTLQSSDAAASHVRQSCLLMMARQAPMASDLKYTLAALRIGQDYERLNELLYSLVERFEQLKPLASAEIQSEVNDILEQIISVHASMRKTWMHDIYETEKVAADPAASTLIRIIYQEIARLQQRVTKELRPEVPTLQLCADLILTCRHFQRITQLLEGLPEEMHCFEQTVDAVLSRAVS